MPNEEWPVDKWDGASCTGSAEDWGTVTASGTGHSAGECCIAFGDILQLKGVGTPTAASADGTC